MLPSWLYQYGYPLAGPATAESMKPLLLINAESRWGIGTLPGWYHLDQQLKYNYVTPAVTSIAASAGSGSVDYPFSLRPAWAPVTLFGSVNETLAFTSAPATGTWTPNTGTIITALAADNGDTAYVAWATGTAASLKVNANYLPGPGDFVITANARTTSSTGTLIYSLYEGDVFIGSGSVAVTGTSYHSTETTISSTKYFKTKEITLVLSAVGDVRLTFLTLNYPYVNQRKYTQLQWHYWPAVPSTWTESATSNVYYTQHDFTEILYEVIGNDIIPWGRAPSIEELGSTSYYYDEDNRNIYVRSSVNPSGSVYPGYLKAEPQLRIREKVWLKGGVIYPLFAEVSNITYSRGSYTVTATGTYSSPLTPSLTGISDYDWVVIEYNVPYSFVIPKHNKLTYYTSPTLGETISVNYETSPPFNISTLNVLGSGSAQELNLNPIFSDSFVEGYLYQDSATTALSGLSTPKTISIQFDKDSYVPDWSEKVGVTITAYDINKQRCPYYPITLTLTNATIAHSVSSSGMLAANGELRLILTGSDSITLAATVGSVTGSATCTSVNAADILTNQRYLEGQVNLAVTDVLEENNYYESFCNTTRLDGIPFGSNTVSVRGKNGTSFVYDNGKTQNLLVLDTEFTLTNLWAISNKIGILPSKKDYVYASRGLGQSIMLRSKN